MDALIALLESLGASPWVFLVFFLAFGVVPAVAWVVRHRIKLEIDHDACSTSVDFQAGRVHRIIVYKVKYPASLALLSLWLYDLEIELHRVPRSVQVDRVGYIHPGQDPLRDDELTEFSKSGKLIVDTRVNAEGARQIIVRQIIPKDAAKQALALRSKVLWFDPICRLKGVDTVVMELSYPLAEMQEDLHELVRIEYDLPAEGILRFVIRKKEYLKKVYGYTLRYRLPSYIKSFTPRVEYNPLEARLPSRPEDISIVSTRSLDRFDRDTPAESYELDWMFDVAQNAIEVRLWYHEA